MTRAWHIDYLDGWRADIAEQHYGDLVVTVTSDTGRAWYAVSPPNDIEEAIALAWHITTEQRLIGCLIDPELPA
jgi:hypothetical protein